MYRALDIYRYYIRYLQDNWDYIYWDYIYLQNYSEIRMNLIMKYFLLVSSTEHILKAKTQLDKFSGIVLVFNLQLYVFQL